MTTAHIPIDFEHPKTYFWKHHGKHPIQVTAFIPNNGQLRVEILHNISSAQPKVKLQIDVLTNGVIFRDLTGNGIQNGTNRKGFGTFAVNTAIQLLKRHCTSNLSISGHIFHTEDGSRSEIEQAIIDGRRRFWSRFGPIAQGDTISGTIKNLELYQAGLVVGEFSVFIPIDQFKPL